MTSLVGLRRSLASLKSGRSVLHTSPKRKREGLPIHGSYAGSVCDELTAIANMNNPRVSVTLFFLPWIFGFIGVVLIKIPDPVKYHSKWAPLGYGLGALSVCCSIGFIFSLFGIFEYLFSKTRHRRGYVFPTSSESFKVENK